MNIFLLCIFASFLLPPKGIEGTVKKQLVVPFINNTNENKTFPTEGIEGNIFWTTTEESKYNCNCSKVYDPVCGSDDKSYSNLCQLECENKSGRVIAKYQGNCIPF